MKPARIYLKAEHGVQIPAMVRQHLIEAIPDSALIWVDSAKGLIDPRDGAIKGGGVMVTLDNIVAVTPAHVSMEAALHFASDGGAGMQYELEKVHGHWLVRRSRMLWVS